MKIYYVWDTETKIYAGNTLPNGWLLCDGSAVSRTDYAELYSVIGDTYGAGDGTSTFNLPNLVDRFVEGSATAGTEKQAGLPNITGTFGIQTDMQFNSSSDAYGTSAFIGVNSRRYYSGNAGSTEENCWSGWDFDASRSSSVYGNSATVQPPALTMQYIIKY